MRSRPVPLAGAADEALALMAWMRAPTPALYESRRRARDRDAKFERYHSDPEYRQRRIAGERARYERNKERIKARMRVENMTPEQVQRQRVRQAARYHREREARAGYGRAYRARPEANVRRRELATTKALLRALFDLLSPPPPPRRVTLEAECQRAALIAASTALVAIPSGRDVPRGTKHGTAL